MRIHCEGRGRKEDASFIASRRIVIIFCRVLLKCDKFYLFSIKIYGKMETTIEDDDDDNDP